MKEKVLKLLEKLTQVEDQLGQSEVMLDQKKYRQLTQEHSYLSQLKELWTEFTSFQKQLQDSKEMLRSETDPEFIAIIEEEIKAAQEKLPKLEKDIENLLIPPDPNDNKNTIMEIRAGTGGDEAAIFVGDCVRMYQLYAADKGWKTELLSCTESDAGGYKEYIMVVAGIGAHRMLQHEAGTHRVQRVPVTETQGRVHTSAITVAILMEPDQEEEIKIEEKDLKIDTYRASGAGGQHVNTTDSAVRITHLPTGVVVYCQQEKSQIKNRDKAMRLLSAKLKEIEEQKRMQEISSLRSSQVGSGDRSERIRTYNFPQNRLTDHRINLTLYSLDHVMNGDLDPVTQPLVSYFYQKKLEEV